LKFLNIAALPMNLAPHMLDFATDMIECHCKPRFARLEQIGNNFASYKWSVSYHSLPDAPLRADERLSSYPSAEAVDRGPPAEVIR
jgi:hypothetical protein